ncbi:MAG: hypothetical protein WDN23_15475 [Edaphobacter sp.]
MDRRVLYVVLLLVVLLFLYLGYNSYDAKRSGASGDVYSAGGKLKTEPAAVSAPEQTVATSPVAGSGAATAVSPETAQVGAADTDTFGANPPNGMKFSGSGRYQLYRQGNITWRLDTQSGKTCIIFATDEEWKKAKVYRNGCGKR